MGRVKTIVAGRAIKEVFSVMETMSVLEVVKVMADHRVGAIGVMNEEKHLSGLFSERDLAHRVVLKGLDPAATQVREVMTRDLLVVDVEDKIDTCKEKMFQANIRHLAVVEGSVFQGLISLRDLLTHEVGEHRETIKYLTDYIYTVPDH